MTTSNLSTAALRTLHRIHRQLADLRERLDRGPKQIRACEAHIQYQEQQCADVHAEVKAVHVATDAKQLQQKAAETKIKDLDGKLMSAASNREYQILKDQIAAERMTNSVLDDEILEGWEKLERMQRESAKADGDLGKAREKAEKTHAEVERQQPLIEDDIRRLEAELSDCEGSMPADVRTLYERGVRQRGEDALAAVENQYCSGCHQHVPLNVCAEIMLDHPMFCKSCGRLLYMSEDGMPGDSPDYS